MSFNNSNHKMISKFKILCRKTSLNQFLGLFIRKKKKLTKSYTYKVQPRIKTNKLSWKRQLVIILLKPRLLSAQIHKKTAVVSSIHKA